jgi:hypothetical protein
VRRLLVVELLTVKRWYVMKFALEARAALTHIGEASRGISKGPGEGARGSREGRQASLPYSAPRGGECLVGPLPQADEICIIGP